MLNIFVQRAFSFSISPSCASSTRLEDRLAGHMLNMNRRLLDDDDEDNEFEYARVRRRRGRFEDDDYSDGRESERGSTSTRDTGTRKKYYDDDYDEIDFENDEEYEES